MSDSEKTVVVVKSEFQIMDNADNTQIQNAETAIKQALAYEVRGKKQLSYMGVKWLVLKMSQKEQALEVLDLPCIELMKHGEDQATWIWYVTVKVKNLKTGLVTVGASESPFLSKNEYDTFGRTKAISKAERNAYRKQIPELEINAMLDTIKSEDIQKLNGSNSSNDTSSYNTEPAPVAAHYLDTLEKLGYTGVPPKTSFEATKLIEKLKSESESAKNPEDYCHCTKPITSSVNSTRCQTCGLKLEDV